MPHFQSSTTGIGEFFQRVPHNFNLKTVNRPDIGVGQPHPFTLRHWADDLQQFDGDWDAKKQRARNYFARFIDQTFREQYAPHVDVIETFNEVWANSQNAAERQARIEQDQAFVAVWNQEYRQQLQQYRPGKPSIPIALMSAAVGNDLPKQSAELAIQENCLLNYHPYVAVFFPQMNVNLSLMDKASNRASFRSSNAPYQVTTKGSVALSGMIEVNPGQRSDGDWRWCSGRWHFMEQEWGLKPKWILSETGPCRDYTGGLILDPQGGWRLIWGAEDRQQMIDMMRLWLDDVVSTPAFAEGRILGFHQFTTGGGETWKHFEVSQPELNMLGDLIAEKWVIQPPPPPPPAFSWNKLVYLVPQDTSPAEYDFVRSIAYPTRSEIAFSADSAFDRPPNANEHKVVMYGVERWGGINAILNYLDERGYVYDDPPTQIEYRNFPGTGAQYRLASDVSEWNGDDIDFEKMKNKGVGTILED